MNKFAEAAKIALASIWSHKLRSFLTLLGVIIGVAVVTAVATIIEGANRYIEEKVAILGSGVFRLQKASITSFGDFQRFLEAFRKNPDLTLEDLAALRQLATLAKQVGAQDGGARPVRYESTVLESIGIQGVTANMIMLLPIEVAQGRYISEFDDENRRDVCFLGAEVAKGLFQNADPIGKQIRIGRDQYTVIGVAKELGTVFGISQDNFVQIPLSTFYKAFGYRKSPTFTIVIRAREGVPIEQAQDQVRLIMRARHKLDYKDADDFSITTDETTQQLFGQIIGVVAAVAFPVVGISLVIGGIVIMNIMLATVTERTREIGIRKSVGATRRDIMVQFLIESSTLSGMGGIMGLLLAVAIMLILKKVAPIPVAIPLWGPALAITVSTCVGLFFGIYPASRAARLDPIAALRAE